jgi:hypothetical protein
METFYIQNCVACMLKYQGWDGVAVTSGCHRKGRLNHKKDKK